MIIRWIDGFKAEKMEEEEQDALEVGKEEAEKAEEEDEEKGRGVVGLLVLPVRIEFIEILIFRKYGKAFIF